MYNIFQIFEHKHSRFAKKNLRWYCWFAFNGGVDPDPEKNFLIYVVTREEHYSFVFWKLFKKGLLLFQKPFWSNVCDVLRQPTESVFFQMIQTIKKSFLILMYNSCKKYVTRERSFLSLTTWKVYIMHSTYRFLNNCVNFRSCKLKRTVSRAGLGFDDIVGLNRRAPGVWWM